MDEFKITFASGTSRHDMKVFTKKLRGKDLVSVTKTAEALIALRPNRRLMSVEYVNPVLAFYGYKG